MSGRSSRSSLGADGAAGEPAGPALSGYAGAGRGQAQAGAESQFCCFPAGQLASVLRPLAVSEFVVREVSLQRDRHVTGPAGRLAGLSVFRVSGFSF